MRLPILSIVSLLLLGPIGCITGSNSGASLGMFSPAIWDVSIDSVVDPDATDLSPSEIYDLPKHDVLVVTAGGLTPLAKVEAIVLNNTRERIEFVRFDHLSYALDPSQLPGLSSTDQNAATFIPVRIVATDIDGDTTSSEPLVLSFLGSNLVDFESSDDDIAAINAAGHRSRTETALAH